MLKVKQAVVVEGKYDKIKLSSIIDGVIIVTNGYGIFKDRDTLELIRYYAEKTGIIILTDSDRAGFRIRGYLKGAVGSGKITNVYIPDVFGKEKRKEKPSSEGKLGVEGIKKQLIIEAFEKAGINFDGSAKRDPEELITPADLFELGLTGRPDSSETRRKLLSSLGLPQKLSVTGMTEILNTMLTRDELEAEMDKITVNDK